MKLFPCTFIKMRGLKTLVCFHQFTGIGYLTWSFDGKMSVKRKVAITLINLILLAIIFIYFQDSVRTRIKFSKDRKFFNQTKKSNLIFILSAITTIGYMISMSYVFVLLLVKGKHILVFLKDQDMKINPKIEFKIGIKVVVYQVLINLLVESLYPINNIVFGGFDNFSIKDSLISFIEYAVLGNIQATLISLMAYYCYYIEEYILELEQNFCSLSQTEFIHHQAIKLHVSVKRFNEYFKESLFMIIILSSMGCVTNATMFYFHVGSKFHYSLVATFECLIRIFIICIISNKIGSSYNNLIYKFEKIEAKLPEQRYSSLYHSLVNRMYSLKDGMCFTAFDLCKINTKTFMQIFSWIITFSVILIQTD